VQDTTTIAITFAVYLAAMLVIGVLAWQRTASMQDYLLGGRKLGSWTAALSAGASDMSGWLLLGLPGYAYASGLESIWIAVGLLIGTWMNWQLVATRLREQTQAADNALTLPEFLSRRFETGLPLIRIIAAFFILIFYLFYTSSGLVAAGKLFQTTFGLPYEWAVTTGLLAVVAYTFIGGFLAVSWTDLVQSLLMLAALVLVPLMALGTQPNAFIFTDNPALMDMWTNADGISLDSIAIISLMAWGLGYFGQPHILARFMAINSPQAVPSARRIAVSWTAITLTGAIMVGLAGINTLATPLSSSESETVFIQLVGMLFHPLPAGLLLAAILAAIMSTADSQLLVASSSLTEDIWRVLFKSQSTEKTRVLIGRLGVLVIAIGAWLLAMTPDSNVLDLVAYAWAGFGAGFGPAILMTLYWPGTSRLGVLLGIITGGVTVIVWKQLSGGIFDLYEIVPGFVFSLLVIVVFSKWENRSQ
jgi:sodium/proline symporter